MVEEVIKRHIDAGYFTGKADGIVYRLPDSDILAVSGRIVHQGGFHARPAAEFVKAAMSHGLDRAYIANLKTGEYGHSRSIIGLLCLTMTVGTHIAVVANHGTKPDQMLDLYRIVTGHDAAPSKRRKH